MQRKELEHVIRAAGSIAEADELIILGSMAILGTYPDAPEELRISREVDIYPAAVPERADLVDGSIGELSPFHEQFGYYAHGVGPETAVLPAGWKERLVAVSNENTGGITGLCLHPADLAISKMIAGREKDLDYVGILLKQELVDEDEIRSLLQELPQDQVDRVESLLKRLRRV